MIRQIALQSPSVAAREDALVLPLYKGKKLSSGSARMDRAFGSVAALLLDGFSAERGETRIASVKRGRRLAHTVLVGLGDAARATPEDLADAAGAAAKVLIANRAQSAAIYLDDAFAGASLDAADVTHAFVKAFGLACHQVKPRPGARLTRLSLRTTASTRVLTPAVRRARLLVDWMVQVRDWVNTPGNEMNPASFTADAKRALAKDGVACRILTRAQIEAEKMNGVLAVGVGSREEPRFLVAERALAKKSWPLVCIIGKGVTFDSGGISIKPWEKMNEMKSDMHGAASVIAAMAMAEALEIPVRMVALAPCVENMPDGAAFRPAT
jgi:leucyl aminopeptidase